MKHVKFIAPFLVLILFACNGAQIEDTTQNQAIAYASGKGLAIAINRVVPEVDKDLTREWLQMMERNKGLEMVPPEEILKFYSDMTGIMALHVGDPYGLIQDLGVLLMLFGAEFDVGGEMISIQPVPMSVLLFFEMGYENGRMVARNERGFS